MESRVLRNVRTTGPIGTRDQQKSMDGKERTPDRSLAEKIQTAQARVSIIGLGSVGLPLATAFAQAGLTVVGLDLDRRCIDAILKGRPYVAGLDVAELCRQVASGSLCPGVDPAVLAGSDVLIICVPTPHSRTQPVNVISICHAARLVAEHLSPGALVVLESIALPGTTEDLLQPLLEAKGLICGRDFELAYSPEALNPDRKLDRLRKEPRIVSGVTANARELAAALYRHVAAEVVPSASPRVAEMGNLLENSFYRGDIALANEMATGLIAETEKLLAVSKRRPAGRRARVSTPARLDNGELLDYPVLHRQVTLAREVVLIGSM
jgi:UDP-N-acetyl-D-glucosamine dehydrogenase